MPRFYCASPLQPGSTITLPPEIAHHLHVLRAAPGHVMSLFDGGGKEFSATLSEIGKKHAVAEIHEQVERDTELPYHLTLAQALPEASKMDWIIEKAVELGVSAIQPLAAQRSVVKLTAERAEKKSQHWRGIIIAASEQSGRTRLAQLDELAEVAKWPATPDSGTRLLLTPRAEHSLAAWTSNQAPQPVTLIVGPEGGFNEQEEALLINQGAIPVSMGARILRTETAGLAALAVVNAAWGQM